jgi:hypothetical protein
MTKFKRLVFSYLFASFTSITVGFVAASLYAHFTKTDVVDWVFVAVIWLIIVGVPSLFAAVDDLTRQLGVKPAPVLREIANRTIPINYDKGVSTFAYVLSGPARQDPNKKPTPTTIDLPELTICYNDEIVTEHQLTDFLKSAWARQRNRKPALSRRWWIDNKRLEFTVYTAIIETLVTYDLITGRRQGRSGRLLYPPLKTLAVLREQL